MSNPLLGDDEESPVTANDLAVSIDTLLGNISAIHKPIRKTARKTPKRPGVTQPIVPLPVVETQLPEGADSLTLTNVVNVPKRDIDKTVANVNLETKRLSRRLMRKLVPLMLSYNSATQYVQAAMREGIGFELSFDQNVAEAIKNVGHLNMIFHFVKHSPIPKDLKQQFMYELSRQLAGKTFENLVGKTTHPASTDLSSMIHAIIGGKKVAKPEEQTADKPKPKVPGVASRRRRN